MNRLAEIGIYFIILPLLCLGLCQMLEMAWREVAGIRWDNPPGNLVMAARIVTVIAAPLGLVLFVIGLCLQLLA